jgi:hypothetical protein
MIRSVYPVWENDFEDYKKRRNALEIKKNSAQNSAYQPPKRISMNLPPPVQNDYENELSESQISNGKNNKQKRRRTPRELMDEIDRGNVN